MNAQIIAVFIVVICQWPIPISGARQAWRCPSKSYLIGLDAENQAMCRQIEYAEDCVERCEWAASCAHIKGDKRHVYLRAFEPGAGAAPVWCCAVGAIRTTQCDTVPWHRGLMIDEYADELIRDITMKKSDYDYDYGEYDELDMHTAEPSMATVCRFTQSPGGCTGHKVVTTRAPLRRTTAKRPNFKFPHNYSEWEAKKKRDSEPWWCKGPGCAHDMTDWRPAEFDMYVHRPLKAEPEGWRKSATRVRRKHPRA